MKFFKKISLFIFVLIFSFLLIPVLVKADGVGSSSPEAPIILDADLASPHSRWGRPIVVGLVAKKTEVLVYVDGKFSGMAKINESKNETNNFYYQSATPLKVGEHIITVVAKDSETKVLSGFSQEKIVIVANLPAPTVFEPNEDTKTGNNKPLISGLTKSGTRVLVYIDGVYNGKTEVINHSSGVAGFVYKPFLHLGVGAHSYFAIAETEFGSRSEKSRVVSFNIEKKYPAPTLLDFNLGKKQVVGLAKNDSKIRIYLDRKVVKEFTVLNHQSGTANFAYTLQDPLTNGAHIVYAVAIDNRGKESIWSNIKSFKIVSATISSSKPLISKEAAVESAVKEIEEEIAKEEVVKKEETVEKEVIKEDIVVEDPDKKQAVENPTVSEKTNTETPVIVEEKNSANVLDEVLGTTTADSVASQTSGLFDETKGSQSKLKLNLVIFVSFLLALVAWIFWVNRELIKERNSKETLVENDPNKKNEKK